MPSGRQPPEEYQHYGYDALYQLTSAGGRTEYNPYRSSEPEYVSEYSQEFAFDAMGLGNMCSKIRRETVSPQKIIGDGLNYSLEYKYDSSYAHRLVSAGERFYTYDAKGNIVCEQDGEAGGEEGITCREVKEEAEDVYSTDYGWGLYPEERKNSAVAEGRYRRTYEWNERNLLISSVDSRYSVSYVYGQDGQRSSKYTSTAETFYFNTMWIVRNDTGSVGSGGQSAKNIYLGETRIVTKLNSYRSPSLQEEMHREYFYHSDHLGSASLISDYRGEEYQRIEYTPYGETWVEKTQNTGSEYLLYKFTGKELDEETGLYYYGARYLEPKYSIWLSTDPALGEYIPSAPVSDEARRHNQNLPGMGGLFNPVNCHLYHYAGNNPVRYVDPDGREEAPYNFRLGDYDFFPTFGGIDTGDKWYNNLWDGFVSYCFIGTYNMCAESLNMLLNGAGESVELLNRGIDLLDENWPCELTFTGGGVRADLQAFEAISATNPMLFAEIFAAVPEVLCYFQGACSEREKLQCLTSFISKARVSGKNLIYDMDNNTKLIFRRDIGPDAHSIRPKYPDKINHYNIEIQKYSQKNHGFQKWRD